MTIHLKPEQERMTQEALQSGSFSSVSEVLDSALKALRGARPPANDTPTKTLLDVLSKPPFAGSDLDLERQNEYPRLLEL